MSTATMKTLVADLCSDACAGRATGTPGGEKARGMVVSALQDAGLDAYCQPVPGCNGANVLAMLPGDIDRWIVVAAHYDHLGQAGDDTYYGADDNAAAVAILVEMSRNLVADRPDGRGIVIASFDAEEPPHFMTGDMGSQWYAQNPVVELDRTDMMICMDLVGHHLGSSEAPEDVRQTMFALGAERSVGTAALVDAISQDDLAVRRIDAEVIPPLSDYEPFWKRDVPFLFLTNGRWQHYHTPQDTPDKLAYGKMGATARWLEQFVRASCQRDDNPKWLHDGYNDASTLRTAIALCESLTAVSREAEMGRDMATALLAACDGAGKLPLVRRAEVQMLVGMLESRLA